MKPRVEHHYDQRAADQRKTKRVAVDRPKPAFITTADKTPSTPDSRTEQTIGTQVPTMIQTGRTVIRTVRFQFPAYPDVFPGGLEWTGRRTIHYMRFLYLHVS